MPRVKREKYPEKAPDLGPLSEHKSLDCWRLVRGSEIVIFARKGEDNHFFIMQRDDKEPIEILAFQARLTYQQLLDKGFKLEVS
tara:strand:+ start:406 stop:657 length:252 start_codon:yes stop_codon:yes gene_type:complete